MIIFYLLIAVMPLSRHRIWGALAGDLTGIKYLGMACLPYALIRLAGQKNLPSFFGTRQARLFLILYSIATLSYFAEGRVPWHLSHWLSYTSFVVLFFVTLTLVRSVSTLRWVVLVAIGSLGFASLYVLRDWQQFRNVYPDYRPGWVVGDPNYFSVSALLFLPAAFLLMQAKRPRWEKLYCFGCFALTMTALMLAASRGGFLGLIAGCIYLILRSGHRLRNFVLVSTALLVITPFTPLNPLERFLHPTQSDEESKDTRMALWTGGWGIMKNYPVFGIGLDNFSFFIAKYIPEENLPRYESVSRVAHNSYVDIAAEMGIPALLVFVGILVCSFHTLEKVRRRAQASGDSTLQRVTIGLQTGLVGAAVAIFFVSAQYQKLFWLVVFLTMCLPPLVRPEDDVAIRDPMKETVRQRLVANHEPRLGGRQASNIGQPVFSGINPLARGRFRTESDLSPGKLSK